MCGYLLHLSLAKMNRIIKQNSASNHSQVHELESLFGNTFPPKLKQFLTEYEWADFVNEDTVFNSITHPEVGDLEIIKRSPMDTIAFTVKADHPDVNQDKGLMIFKSIFGIYVSTAEGKKDMVFAKPLRGADFIKVADDIFEFLDSLTDNLIGDCSTEEQYRNCMIKMGFEDEDLEEEVSEWKLYHEE